ncbi:hypothetical protein [Alkalilimnicola ehrlichii]|uniref:hypothetical protein n=1 Tax=Alkalilimnicola ehrlichii TaxID=351052 RepID=UPI003BA1B8E9
MQQDIRHFLAATNEIILGKVHQVRLARVGDRGAVLPEDILAVFVLPSRYGLFLTLVAALVWLGGVNYTTDMALLLSCLLIGLIAVGIHHTFRNLHRPTLLDRAQQPHGARSDQRTGPLGRRPSQRRTPSASNTP